MTRDQLETRQTPLYFATVLVAIAFGLVADASASVLEALITPAIAVLMYAMFLQIPFLHLRASLANRRFMTALLLANFVLVPVLAWALTRGLTGHPALLIGALLVLLAPCIDYVVVFTHMGKGDARLMLATTPVLLLLQLVLLPLYLALMLEDGDHISLALGPFVQAFVLMIVVPLALAVLTSAHVAKSERVSRWNDAWAWMPVPAMALVLFVVIASQIGIVSQALDQLLPVVPVFLGFALLAPGIGWATARLMDLPVQQKRAVMFSASTRNSLVVLPLALALPAQMRTLAAAAVITQTLVELICELVYVRAFPVVART
ncbi:arsenic resistance protein [Pseudomonas fulva]|uniref:arsenic resistance protein n=1 Tax=Pseudomonas fulva TaxID=47880 RepID=UPI0015F72FC1|nr:bile acid:sodium symporter [Pseudomonas fulva]MBA5708942.1 arsenic resistance protein [Pseudomonas fulva]